MQLSRIYSPHHSDSKSNGRIWNRSVTKTSHHALVITAITPDRIGSHPPHPSRGDGGHDPIRGHVHSFRPGTQGYATVGGADPVHPFSSRARSRRGSRRPARWRPMARHVPKGGNRFQTARAHAPPGPSTPGLCPVHRLEVTVLGPP
jgi:hypothetical protein